MAREIKRATSSRPTTQPLWVGGVEEWWLFLMETTPKNPLFSYFN
jgi:hypothetical protein